MPKKNTRKSKIPRLSKAAALKKKAVILKAKKVAKVINNRVEKLKSWDIDTKTAFQQHLSIEAGKLAKDMIELAKKEKSVIAKAQVLKAYAVYRNLETKDNMAILEMIARMPKNKMQALENSLKIKSVSDDMSRGKSTLADIYDLPLINKD